MNIIRCPEFDTYWKRVALPTENAAVFSVVTAVIAAVRREGDAAVRRFAAQFDKSSPENLRVSPDLAKAAWEKLKHTEPELAAALELAATHIRTFSEQQKSQLINFEYEMSPGLIAGQRVIPVQRAGVYVPSGRFPLISSVLMGVIPALVAGVAEVVLASPPLETGLPDTRIMAAAHLAGATRIFAVGGAQAIAALALGTETIPQVDVIAGPGNKYVAAAKRLLFGEVGIDFIAGPTDVLIIADPEDAAVEEAAEFIAADMLAQAEHDPDACARALVPNQHTADRLCMALDARLEQLPTAMTAKASLDRGGLIIIYHAKEDALHIANTIAPEHLELQVHNPDDWIPFLKNYGSLFIGTLAVEALGDYSAGINHTLPTAGSARFTGGLSVRHFLKIVTSLRCSPGQGYEAARFAAEQIARAEGLAAHKESAAIRNASRK
jgi:histidinol dehydrogenase